MRSPKTFVLAFLTSLFLVASALSFTSSAQASVVNVNNTALDFSKGSTVVGANATQGFTERYSNVITIGGQVIDALVTAKTVSNATIDNVDNTGTNQGSPDRMINTNISVTANGGFIVLNVTFLDGGTNDVATLQNVTINVSDIDRKQFVQFAGPQTYKVRNPTNLEIQSSAATRPAGVSLNGSIPAGSILFVEQNDAGSNATDTPHWTEVTYAQISTIDIKVGANKVNGAFYGIEFAAANWGNDAVTNPTLAATNYTISYDANTATTGTAPGSTSGAGSLTLAYNTGNMVKPGYAFGGWNTRADGTGSTVAPGASFTPSGDTTLYALWIQGAYEVTYDSQGGSGVASSTFLSGGSFTLRPGSTWAGHTFLGWFTAASGGTAITSPYSPGVTSNITLYAQWSGNTVYTVTYDSQGGSSTANGSFSSGGTVTLPANPTWAGHTFLGWFAASTGGTSLSSPYTPGVTSNITLYAQWSTNTAQTITLTDPGTQNLSSNSVTLNPSATSGLTVVLTSSTPSVCTVSGNIVTFVGPGTCTIVGNQAGNGTYSAAPAVTISFLVSGPSTPTVVAPAAETPTTRFIRRVTPAPAPAAAAPAVVAAPAASNAAPPVTTNGQRSVGEIASEAIGGFKPGTGLRVEVTGSRISGQFVVSPASIADPIALAAAIKESTSRTKSDFAQVNAVTPLETAPKTEEIFDTAITPKMLELFKASGLSKPRTVGDLDPGKNQKWLSVEAAVQGYVPGSRVFLVVTTKPTILAGVKVGDDGKAILDGLLPVDLLAAGGHNIRLVGTRLIDGVSTDANGEITLDKTAITEIKKFDEGTKATVVLSGTSDKGSSLTAVREVYLDKFIAWWTVWLAAGIALLALIIRFVKRPARFNRRVTTTVIAFAGGIPALMFGWLTASYELWIGTGISIVVALICFFWGRIGGRRSRMTD